MYAARPLEDEEKLEKIYDEKNEGTNRYRSLFTNPNQSPLGLLLRGPQAGIVDKSMKMDKAKPNLQMLKMKTTQAGRRQALDADSDVDAVAAWEEERRQMLELQVDELQDKVNDYEVELE